MSDSEVVLGHLKEAKFTVKSSKWRFSQNHLKFLGHEVGSGKKSPKEG